MSSKFYVALLLLYVRCCSTEVSVENGGYSVLVSFSRNVPFKDGNVLLNNMRESLKETSEILQNAIGFRFSKVIFKIPSSWDTSDWSISVERSFNVSTSTADFLIENTNDVVFGKLPFAQQYGGCGMPGRQITVPTAFFDDANSFPKGISLAREWLKYRYGVFDENGYFSDSLYPLYYTRPGNDPNEVEITDCTNAPITYNFLDQEGNNCSTSDKTLSERLSSRECAIKPEENEAVTSSMMYFQEDIKSLQHICGKYSDHSHNSKAPNKHNILCFGQSIWDVLKNSHDFKNDVNGEVDIEGNTDIEFVYTQEPKPKIVVAWENTAQMKNKGPVILSALKQFVIDLPSGSKFNSFPFKSNVPPPEKRSYSFHELNGLGDKKLVVDLTLSDFVINEMGDINLAIRTALEIFSSEPDEFEAGGTIIIITKSIQAADEAVLQRLTESKLCIMFLLFSEDGIPDDSIAEITRYGTASSCPTVEEFLMTDKDEGTYEKLLRVMETVLPLPEEDKTTETAKIEYLTAESSISLHVDDSVESVTFSVFSKKEGENFQLEFNEVIKENAFKEELIGDVLLLSYLPTEAGNIKFAFPHETERPMLTHVRVTSKEGKYFSGEIIVHDTSDEGTVQMPVIIYAIIRFGAYPVQNARVLAVVERPNGKPVTFELNDNGRGNPDITQNDGVYSRYFTSFSEAGKYTVTVIVKNREGHTTFGADENAGYKSCCGSYVNDDTSELAEFTKELKATFTARDGRPDNGYKPSRIFDLRVDKVTDDKITLKWTAPGEEADSGRASHYEIKIFCGEENVTVCDMHKMVRVLNKPPPLNYGTEQKLTIQIITNTEILSVGIETVNEKDKQSDMSNIIEIFRPVHNPLEITTIDPRPPSRQATSASTIISIVMGCIIIIVVFTLAIIFYFRKKLKSKEPEIYEIEENINKDNQEVKSTFKANDYLVKSIPMKKIESFPVLLYTHDQIKDFKSKDKDPPLYKAPVPPKMWKSLDVMSNIKHTESERDTKSLSSSSTVQVDIDDSEGNAVNDVESENK